MRAHNINLFGWIFFTFLLLIASGCAKQGSEFEGNWVGNKRSFVLQITRDDGGLTLNFMCDGCNSEGKHHVEYADGKLKMASAFGDEYITWVQKGKTVLFFADEYHKLPE